MATIALVAAAGLQLAMPWSVDLPRQSRQVPLRAPALPQAAQQVYTAIIAHPVFAPDRAPPPAEAEASGNLSGVEVLGTAIAGKTAAAALLRDSDGTLSRVKIGEVIEGWKLVSIEPTELTFDRNGERRALTVDVTAPRVRANGSADQGKSSSANANASDDSDDDSDDSDDSDE
jgi:hypothetical protein